MVNYDVPLRSSSRKPFSTPVEGKQSTRSRDSLTIQHRLGGVIVNVDLHCVLKHSDQYPKMLAPYLLLHLHGLNTVELADQQVVRSEVQRLARTILPGYQRIAMKFHPSTREDLHATRFRFVEPSIAALIHRRLHYLQSPRSAGLHLGLQQEGSTQIEPKLLSLVTISPFDLFHIADSLPFNLDARQIMVLSRFVLFDWSPSNTGSYTLAKLTSWLHQNYPNVRMLITYLDPNVGFHGSLYRAANGVLFGREKKQRYLFLDRQYVTDRYMIEQYGTADLKKLRPILGHRIATSQVPLEPLEIYAWFLESALRKKAPRTFGYEINPPCELVGG